jgi:hypothetical protein
MSWSLVAEEDRKGRKWDVEEESVEEDEDEEEVSDDDEEEVSSDESDDVSGESIVLNVDT